MKKPPDISHFDTLAALNQECVRNLVPLISETLKKRGGFTLALSGGSTPKSLYTLLSSAPICAQIDWSKVHFFWGDERCVPPDHSDSNFKMADDALLSHISGQVFRMKGELEPGLAAADYEDGLKNAPLLWPPSVSKSKWPTFDLILLGLGSDGHTASLFPQSEALQEKSRLVCAVAAPSGKPSVPRLTMTLPVINKARNVWFIAAGENKREIIAQILAGEERYPASQVRPQGIIHWFVAT